MLKDGIFIELQVEMILSFHTPAGISKLVGLGLIGFADVYAQLRPDLVILLGDR